MLRLDFDVAPLMRQAERLEKVVKAAIRPAAFAASDAFYKEVRTRALTVGGSAGLQAAIYQKFVITDKAGVSGDSATYHISWRKQRARTSLNKAANPDAGLPYSTIGYWIEFGRLQRYAVYLAKDGQWYTAVRPEKRGTPRPKASASQATKDAYFLPRPGGPVQWLPKSFLRSSYEAKKSEAMQAASTRLRQLVREGMPS